MLTLNIFLHQLQEFHDEADDFTTIDKTGNSLRVEGVFKNLCIEDIDIHIEENGKVAIIKTEDYLLEGVEDRGLSTFDVHDYIAETTIGTRETIVAETTILDFEEYIDFIEDYAQQLEIEIQVVKEHKRMNALGKKYKKKRESLMTAIEIAVDPDDGFTESKMVSVYFRKTTMGEEVVSHKLDYNHLVEQNVFNVSDAIFTPASIRIKNNEKILEFPLCESIERFIDDKVWP